MKQSSSLEEGMNTESHLHNKALLPVIIGVLLFFLLGLGVEYFHLEYRQQRTADLKAATLSHIDALRARLEGELNAVYFLSYGIADNWTVHHNPSDADDTRKVMMELYRHSRHVRSFAITVGARVAYGYPDNVVGESAASELTGKSLQWPMSLQIPEIHAPLLAWSNSHRLSYVLPIYEDGQLLGVLNTLIDEASLFSAAGLTQTSGGYVCALREQSKEGNNHEIVLGPTQLFGDAIALVSNIPVPGGSWQLAVKPASEPMSEMWPWFFRVFGWVFAALFSSLAVALWILTRRLADQALYDRLTGLPSRHLFLDRLKQVIRRTKRGEGSFSILFINLIEFRSVNENHGGKAGDMLLTGIGKRISGYVRHCDTVTRWKGEEFLILLDECPRNQADTIAENLRHLIELPVYCGEEKLCISTCMGIATYPDDGHSLTALLKVAGARKSKDKSRLANN